MTVYEGAEALAQLDKEADKRGRIIRAAEADLAHINLLRGEIDRIPQGVIFTEWDRADDGLSVGVTPLTEATVFVGGGLGKGEAYNTHHLRDPRRITLKVGERPTIQVGKDVRSLSGSDPKRPARVMALYQKKDGVVVVFDGYGAVMVLANAEGSA